MPNKVNEKPSSKRHNCHSSGESKKEKSEKEDCGRVCQSDDIFNIDSDVVDFSQASSELDSIFTSENFSLTLGPKLVFTMATHDPPGYGFYSRVAVFIQKSSYLI